MTGKYTKDNPMPRAELARITRNTNRRILTRKKRQTAQKTLEQFEQVLFAAITTHGKKMNDADSASLKTVIKEYVFSEKDAATASARKMKSFCVEYKLTKQDYVAAVESTD